MPAAINMTEGKPRGLLLRFALPIILGNAFQLLYTVADSAVVGRLIGIDAFGAVGAAGFLYWLALSVVLGLTQGFGAVLARRFGAGNRESLHAVIAAAFVLTLVLGMAFSLTGFAVATPVLRLLRTPQDILGDAVRYLQILFAGLLVTFLYNCLGALLRARGDSKTPLYALLLASACNILLDILLVLYTPLGVAAVAVATVAAQAVACGYCLAHLGLGVRLGALPWGAGRGETRELLRMGVPMGLRNAVIALGGVAAQYVINGYGTEFIAGIAAAKKVYGLLEIVAAGLDGAVATYVAQNFGAQRGERIEPGVRSARNMMLVSSCAIAVLMVPCGRRVLSLLVTGDPAQMALVLDAGTGMLRAMLLTLPTLYLLFLYRSALQGVGNSLFPLLSGFVELGSRLLGLLALPALFGAGGVFAAEVLGWPLAGLFLYLAYRSVRSRGWTNEKAMTNQGGA